MFQKLKRWSAKKAINPLLVEHAPKSAEASKKVGIILDLDVMEEGFDLSDLRKELEIPYELFYPIVHSSEKPIPEKYSLEEFDENNLGWNATFASDSKERIFQEMEYDLLLNYFTQPPPELLVLSATVKACLKVGFPLAEKRLNDMEINTAPENYRLFAEELKKYLSVIKLD